MKRLFGLALSLLMVGSTGLYWSCSDAPRGDNTSITEKQEASEARGATFIADTANSKVRFTGRGVGKNHPGIFKLSAGSVAVANDQVTGGDFVINIKSLELEQKGGMFDEKLHPHLMSGDFFDAEKFNTAKFEITKVEPYKAGTTDASVVDGANYSISGNLTLKDVTRNITFPAKVDLDGDILKAKGNFDIDRTQWNMNYGNDKSLGDKFISEKVNIELDLQAKKQ